MATRCAGRLGLALALLAVAGTAAPAQARPRDRNFWEWVIDPHGAEIRVVLAHSERLLRDAAGQPDEDPAARAMREDARGMLRFGLRLEPDHPRLLYTLGMACDDLGLLDEAVAAFERYLAVEFNDKLQPEARLRLGRIHARRGDRRAAIAQLTHGAARAEAPAALALAEVYQDLGRMDDAIELLESQLRRRGNIGYGDDSRVALALAVAYDRDEQLTRAREIMERLINQRSGGRVIDILRQQYGSPPDFLTAAERHYTQAFLYEVAGYRQDARAEWLHYARTGARHRARALAHVRAIDAGEPPIATAPPQTRPLHPPRYPHRPHHGGTP